MFSFRHCSLTHDYSYVLAQFPDILGKGAFKTVYKGQDVNNGWLVAWNEVNIRAYGKKERARIMNEIMLLRTLSHPNLISFYGGWVNKESEKVVFVTELMSSGTLKDFTSKYPIPCKQIKRYAREILECIHYLHTPQAVTDGLLSSAAATPAPSTQGTQAAVSAPQAKPVVIHRDLKCDNIFIQAQGKGIKIGDLGLATTDGRSVMGTPEFMAPEMYETGYSTSVDIYAFGLCLLEMVTGKTPYVECGGVVAIYKRVLAGVLPENIRVLEAGWPEAYFFILRCLQPLPEPDARPAALPSISENAGGDEDDSEGEETETEAPVPDVSAPAAPPAAGVATQEPDTSSASHVIAQQQGGPLESSRQPSSTLPRRTKPRQYLRPTALELLQDPFLQVTEEDATRTTWDVRKVAEAKSVAVIVGPEDPNRPSEWPAVSVVTAAPSREPEPSSAFSADKVQESQQRPEAEPLQRTNDESQQDVAQSSGRQPSAARPREGEKARRPGRGSSHLGGSAVQSGGISLQGLAEEVKTLRHWVAQTYGLVEWLVLQQDGGKAFMESRAGRRISQREDKPPESQAETESRRSIRSKSVTFAEPSDSVNTAASETLVGTTDVVAESHTAEPTTAANEMLLSTTIESVLAGFSATGDDLMEEHFSGDLSESTRMMLSKMRFDCRKEEFKLARIAAKQVQEFAENHRRLNEEHADAVSSEQERHRKQVENFEKSRTEILKVLGPIRSKRQKIEEESEVSADEEGLSLRERTEEQMYSRRLDLLIGREADEDIAHRDALTTIEDNFKKSILRYETKEKEIRDAFAAKVEKLRTEAAQAYSRALELSSKAYDGLKATDISSESALPTSEGRPEGDKLTSSPVRDEGSYFTGPTQPFNAKSPQLLFFANQEKDEGLLAGQMKDHSSDGPQASPKATHSSPDEPRH